ncbi:hypothetical protein FDECE_11242 [Fusarium decemcellulare]|nr:hypothetical protein FDECE_11242 [Fusarium decemcellulare]
MLKNQGSAQQVHDPSYNGIRGVIRGHIRDAFRRIHMHRNPPNQPGDDSDDVAHLSGSYRNTQIYPEFWDGMGGIWIQPHLPSGYGIIRRPQDVRAPNQEFPYKGSGRSMGCKEQGLFEAVADGPATPPVSNKSLRLRLFPWLSLQSRWLASEIHTPLTKCQTGGWWLNSSMERLTRRAVKGMEAFTQVAPCQEAVPIGCIPQPYDAPRPLTTQIDPCQLGDMAQLVEVALVLY